MSTHIVVWISISDLGECTVEQAAEYLRMAEKVLNERLKPTTVGVFFSRDGQNKMRVYTTTSRGIYDSDNMPIDSTVNDILSEVYEQWQDTI